MADPWHVKWLQEGVVKWNRRRKRVSFKPNLSNLNFFELLPPDFRDDPKTSRYFEKIDLRDADLNGSDLSRLNFRKADFQNAQMVEADLSRSNFEQANFGFAKLKGADFSGSLLIGAEFEEANLENVSFLEAEVDSAVFISTDISEQQREQLTSRAVQVFASRAEYEAAVEQIEAGHVPRRLEDVTRASGSFRDEDKTRKNAYEVFYGTTRNPIYERGAVTDYSDQQWEEINYGVAEVIVPDGHRLGGIGKRLFRRLWNKQSDKLRLNTLITLNQELFFEILKRVDKRSGDFQRPTIFIHGYRTSFLEAVLLAAQFGHDLGINQGIGLFSWPSKGSELAYLADEASAEVNRYALSEFIESFVEAFSEHGVSIVAHSMGCRTLLGAVELLASRNRKAADSLHQVILAAADVDSAIMPHIGKPTISCADRTTSYVGDRDKALKLSSWLHRFHRVGLVPPPFVMDGLDTVLVNDQDLGAFSHGYIGQSRAVLSDIHSLLKRNDPPSDRFSVKLTEIAGEKIWKLAD